MLVLNILPGSAPCASRLCYRSCRGTHCLCTQFKHFRARSEGKCLGYRQMVPRPHGRGSIFLRNLDSTAVTQYRHPQSRLTNRRLQGHTVALLVKALHYEPGGRGFNSRWCHWNFQWHNPSGRTMALGLTQPLTEMSTRHISWWVKAAGA